MLFHLEVLLTKQMAEWKLGFHPSAQLSSVQSLSRVRLFATPWTAVRQASLSITNSQSFWPTDWTPVSYISCIGKQVLYH